MHRGKPATIVAFAFVLAFGSIAVSAAGATVTIRVEGMHCGGCASLVEKKLKATEKFCTLGRQQISLAAPPQMNVMSAIKLIWP